jgi:hypothetical protein
MFGAVYFGQGYFGSSSAEQPQSFFPDIELRCTIARTLDCALAINQSIDVGGDMTQH